MIPGKRVIRVDPVPQILANKNCPIIEIFILLKSNFKSFVLYQPNIFLIAYIHQGFPTFYQPHTSKWKNKILYTTIHRHKMGFMHGVGGEYTPVPTKNFQEFIFLQYFCQKPTLQVPNIIVLGKKQKFWLLCVLHKTSPHTPVVYIP